MAAGVDGDIFGSVYPASAVVAVFAAADDAAVCALNQSLRRWPGASRWTRLLAARLAPVEVGLMLLLACGGRRSALRMLVAVGIIYVASEVLGGICPRARPFERLTGVQALAEHSSGRSFPSRHVASGLAMAIIGGREHARLGLVMAVVAALLGLSRVGAGLHYPSDVAAGAVVGQLVGGLMRR
jgi:undecaprenyl-diphosphatase